jgi:Ca2+-binding EF-hand superfamily protein
MGIVVLTYVDVGAACRSMDRDNSGSISANELANVAVGGSVLGIDNGMKLIRVFDVDGNGTIGTSSFSRLLPCCYA